MLGGGHNGAEGAALCFQKPLMPRDGRPFRCFKKTCCAAVPVPFLPIPHAGLFPCDCGHANKYCGVCDAFFERVVDCADPGRSSRMGYHYAGHVPRQNFADRVLWGSAGAAARGGGRRDLVPAAGRSPWCGGQAVSPVPAVAVWENDLIALSGLSRPAPCAVPSAVCARVCVRMCMRACVRECVFVFVFVCVCVPLHVFALV